MEKGFRYGRSEVPVDVNSVIREIDDVVKEEAARQRYRQALELEKQAAIRCQPIDDLRVAWCLSREETP